MKDVYVWSGIINMYSKCNLVEDASKGFHKVIKLDTMLWNAMIARYTTCFV